MQVRRIQNCYDSHTHFWATGQVALGLQLNQLKNESDVCFLKLKNNYYRADWLVGFGWDQNKWPQKNLPNKKILDEVFPETPVFFSRVDGHASWINSIAIQILKSKGFDFSRDPEGGRILRDEDNQPTGVLFDQAHIQALQMLPDFSENQHLSFFSESQKIFNQAGFTHVRDLSMNLSAWNLLTKKFEEKDLSVCIDSFVTAENLSDLPRVLKEISSMKQSPCEYLRVHGVKIFVDGSLGSKTAYLSQNYLGTSQAGILIWKADEIKELLHQVWSLNLEVAVHVIGDQAVHEVVQAARKVSADGLLGRLHLEHVQMLRTETVQLMKPLHIRCHMQPCHWLNDHLWLENVIPKPLSGTLFQ
jgi:predicted amidohydrolase YtcJ